MEGSGSIIGVIFGMIIVGCLFTLIGVDIHEDLTVIDTRVETIDGKTDDCTEAYANDNGMTYIRKPYYMQIPTKTVKLIKRLD